MDVRDRIQRLHGLGGVGRRGVEADRGVRGRQLMDEVDAPSRTAAGALFGLAQPRADHDAVEALVAQCGRDAGFGGRVEIGIRQLSDLVAEITAGSSNCASI